MLIVKTYKVLVIFIMLAFLPVPAWTQSQDWEKEWNEIIAAAKKEGKVVVKGDDDPKTRLELPGSGQVTLMNNAPHPNAAILFINWLVSREGLEIYSRTQSSATTRRDIDEPFLPPEEIPRPGVNYFASDNWEFKTLQEEKIRLRMKELLKR